jgi:hypothetical protein
VILREPSQSCVLGQDITEFRLFLYVYHTRKNRNTIIGQLGLFELFWIVGGDVLTLCQRQ